MIFFAINAQRNLDHVIFLRNFHGGWLTAEGRIFEKVFRDQNPREEATEERIFKWVRNEVLREVLDELRPPGGWYRPVDRTVLERSAEKLPFFYFATLEADFFKGNPQWQKLASVSTLTGSLYGRVLKKIKKKSSRTLHLYKRL